MLALAAHIALAADPADCTRIADDAARLACYDAAFGRGKTPAVDEYVPVEFRELWVNFRGHVGKKIRVDGEIADVADPGFATFAQRLPAANTIRVRITGLPEDTRVRIAQSCRRSCKVTVKGIPSASRQNHIVADEIVFENNVGAQERNGRRAQ